MNSKADRRIRKLKERHDHTSQLIARQKRASRRGIMIGDKDYYVVTDPRAGRILTGGR